MSSEWQGSYQRDERMLLGHTGIGASGLGSTPDSRSCAPLWIEPIVYQVAFPPPDLETMQVYLCIHVLVCHPSPSAHIRASRPQAACR